jgi:hypothetical protein
MNHRHHRLYVTQHSVKKAPFDGSQRLNLWCSDATALMGRNDVGPKASAELALFSNSFILIPKKKNDYRRYERCCGYWVWSVGEKPCP